MNLQLPVMSILKLRTKTVKFFCMPYRGIGYTFVDITRLNFTLLNDNPEKVVFSGF